VRKPGFLGELRTQGFGFYPVDVSYFGGIEGQRDRSLESTDQYVVVFVLYAAACRIMGMVYESSSLVQCWRFDAQLGAETDNGGRYWSDSRSGMATASIWV